MEKIQHLMVQCLSDTPVKRAKLYGLALLRAINTPRTISLALGIGKNRRSYDQAFSSLYHDYAFVFTDTTHQYFHPDIRDFLRQHLLAKRNEPDISKLIIHIHENQQRRLHDVEQEQTYQDLRTRLRDERWVDTFLDLLEAQFWADPSAGVSYAISFLLAASLYHPHLVHEVVDISSFFVGEMGSPQRDWWFHVCQGFNLFASSLQLYEKVEALNKIKEMITQEKMPLSSPFTAYSPQLTAALWWQQGELYGDFNLREALTCYIKALPFLYPKEQVPESTARLYWILVERTSDPQLQIEVLTKVIEHNPGFVDAYYELGNMYFDLEKYQLARTFYQYVIELKPHHIDAWINLGVIHTRLKEYQRALDELNYAEHLNAANALLYFNRANVYRELRKYADALKDFDKTIELDKTYAPAYTNRGNIYATFNMLEQASQDYEEAIRLQPDDMQALWLQEWIHFGKQRVTQTIAQRLQEIAACNPSHYLAAVCVGIAKGLTEKDLKQALPELEHGCQQAPDQWDAYFWLGMLAAYLNRSEQAATALYKAIELGLTIAFLLPLYWLEKDRPAFFQRYAQPLLQKNAL